ncbi:MAG: preprotein translocase subunit SecG [Burkholderiaceae bacterium]|nr:preprotein translocase subunit SecG [Burkholderiaceae bacterium]
MAWLTNLLMVLQVLTALGVIVLVLLQHGKGADMGAAFGGGASGSLFGATGSANFLSRTTAVLAALFFLCTLGLALLASQPREAPRSVMEGATVPAPASPASRATPADVPPAGAAATGAAAAGTPAPAAATPSNGAQVPATAAPASKDGAGSEIPK